MVHKVDGFELKFTSRTSWKAERRHVGQVVDIVPVTWTKGWRQDPETRDIFQEVWYQDKDEMMERNSSREHFVVAVAIAKDYETLPHEFGSFRALFEVVATGKVLSENSIETKVLERAKS